MKKIIFLLLLYSSQLMAASASANMIDVNASSELMKVMFGLLMVVAVIFALSFVVKKMNGLNMLANSQYFKVIAAMSLSTREKLVLVKAGDSFLLLGVSSNGITKLHDYGDSLDLSEESPHKFEFSNLFNKLKKNE